MSTDWGSRETRLELAATVLLALATLASTWCAYQSTVWSGVQMILLTRADAVRTSAVGESNRGDQLAAIDVGLFVQYTTAVTEGNQRLADFLQKRFRPEFKKAFIAWMATNPQKNPNAPPSPFVMPEYKLEARAKADEMYKLADRTTEDAKEANRNSDNYVLLTVIFASVLFFAGIATKLSKWPMRLGTTILGWVLFWGALGVLLTYPVP